MFVVLSVVLFIMFIYGCGEHISQSKKNSLDAKWCTAEDSYLDATDRLRNQYYQLGYQAPDEF